jgi:anaphase-promoting complex subunit 3
MSPSGVNAQLRQLIHYHLDNGFHENALFLAGRLHALDVRNPDAIHLLALCNLRLGRYKAAFDLAQPKSRQPQQQIHLGCAYVFAQACLGLERHDAGAQVLEKTRGIWAGRNHFSESDITTLQPQTNFSSKTSTQTLHDATFQMPPPVTACLGSSTAVMVIRRRL